MIETAIVLPLYMIVLFGLIYFGYATLSNQRLTTSASYSAWLQGNQEADKMLERFWPWEGTAVDHGSTGGKSEAESGDTTLVIGEVSPSGDPYYGIVIGTQLGAGQGTVRGLDAWPNRDDFFDLERLTVSLWDYALGEVNQSFSMGDSPGEFEEQLTVHFDSIARFLNVAAQEDGPEADKIGWIETPTDVDPDAEESPTVSEYEPLIADAINGGDPKWLERRQVTIEATYRPSFFKNVYSEEGAPPSDYATYISLQYEDPDYEPTSTARFDLTGRSAGTRYAAGEQGSDSEDVLNNVADFLDDGALPPADDMDPVSLGGRTVLELCVSGETVDF